MKLGFKYIEVDTGDIERLKIGAGNWAFQANITNFQKAFLADNIPVKDDRSILLSYKYISEGLLLALSRRLGSGDRGPERSNETLWIFIPKEIKISPEETGDIVAAAQQVLVERKALRDEVSFERFAPEVLTKEYPTSPFPAFRTGNMTGTDFAVLEINGNQNVYAIICAGYQNEYAKYGFIVVNQSGGSVTDAPKINPAGIKYPIWVRLPKEWPQNLHTTDKISVLIDNAPIAPEGGFYEPGMHSMTISRAGFVPFQIFVEVKAGNPEFRYPPLLNEVSWLKKIDTNKLSFSRPDGSKVATGLTLSSPDAYNAKGQPSNSFRYGDIICVPEKNLQDFSLLVTDNRFNPITQTVDLTRMPLNIVITPKVVSRGTDKNGRAYPDGNRAESGRNDYAGGFNSDNYKSLNAKLEREIKKKNKKIAALWFSVGVLIGAVIVFLVLFLVKAKADQKDTNSIEQFSEQSIQSDTEGHSSNQDLQQNETTDANSPQAIEAAVAYLDNPGNGTGNSVTWDKAEMDKYPALNGLFEDLNNFNLQALVDNWKPKLQQSQKFQYIAASAEKNLKNHWNPRQGIHNPTYNKDGDYMINVQNYAFWLDKDQSSQPSATQGAPAVPKTTSTPETAPKTEKPKTPSSPNRSSNTMEDF